MTAQIHEILVLDGRRMGMTYFPPLPSPERQMRGLSDQEKEAARNGAWQWLAAAAAEERLGSFISSTACWRRYRGTWEIIDDRLYLMHVDGRRFERLGDLPLLADWFTGALCVPTGRVLRYVHMDFETIYEGELHIDIESGRVTGRWQRDNRDLKFDDDP